MDIGTFLSIKELLFSKDHPAILGGVSYENPSLRMFLVTEFVTTNLGDTELKSLWASDLGERIARHAQTIEQSKTKNPLKLIGPPYFSRKDFTDWVKKRIAINAISGPPNQIAARSIIIALVVEYARRGMAVPADTQEMLRADIENYELLERIHPLLNENVARIAKMGGQLEEQLLSARNDYLSMATAAKEELNHIETMRHATRAEVGTLIEATGKQVSEIKEQADTIDSLIEAARSEADALSKKVIVTGENIKAFASAVREELKIDGTRKLWAKRAKQHRTAFWISTFVIAGGLVVPPYWGFTHVESVLAFLQHVGAAVNESAVSNPSDSQIFAGAVSRLVIVSIPIALYFWALKLAIRFNQRALALADDAEQRGTMMDTYFHLIEQQGASSEERALILNALFRPLAGAQSEHVEPPNFIDLLPRPK